MEHNTLTEKILGYVKTPYFAVFCIVLLVFIIWWFKDSFTAAKKPSKDDEIDEIIDSIKKKQSKLKDD